MQPESDICCDIDFSQKSKYTSKVTRIIDPITF